MLTEPAFYAVALPAVVLYGLSKGGFGGVSLLAIPLMSLVISPVQAAAILLPVLLVQDVVTIYSYRNDWDRTTLALTLPGALAGILFGAFTAALVSIPLIRLAVGALAIGFCLNAWFGPDLRSTTPKPHSAPIATALGALAGYTSFVIHAGAPPFNMYAMPRLIDSARFVGTAAVFFGIVNLLKVLPYAMLGQFSVDTLALSAILVPVAVAGNMLGIWLVRRLRQDLFRSIIYVLTFAVGLKLLFDGWQQWSAVG